jgi:chromosome segregation ATPase
VDESTGPPRREEPRTDDVDRLEALEQQVRQLTSRLAGWVEAQLVQAMDDRRNDLKALRSELQMVVNEQLAGVRAETASILSVATHRIDVGQEQLRARLDAVAARAADPVAPVDASRLEELGRRVDGLARQLNGDRSDLAERQQAEVVALRSELAERAQAQVDALRSELEAALIGRIEAAGGRTQAAEGLEQRVRQAVSRLTDSVEARLGEIDAARRADADGLRREILSQVDDRLAEATSRSGAGVAAVQERLSQQLATVTERVDVVAGQAAAAAAALEASTAEAAAETARAEAFEQRVKSAMARLTDSVETRLAESVTARQQETDRLWADVARQADGATVEAGKAREAAADALARAQAGADRMAVLEQQVKAAIAAATGAVDAKVAALAGGTKTGDDTLRAELRAEMAQQLREARTEIGTAIDATHKRLSLSLEALDDRMRAFAEQAGPLTGSLEVLDATVASDGARLEALELHTRRTDAKLTELVEDRFAVLASDRDAELAAFRTDLQAAVATELGQLRAEVAAAVEGTRREVAAATAKVAEQGAELAAAAEVSAARARAEHEAALEAVRTEVALGAGRFETQREDLQAVAAAQLAEARRELADAADAARSELAAGAAGLEEGRNALAAQVAAAAAAVEAQAELVATVASLGRRADRAQDRARKLTERIEELAADLARVGSAESAALAPVRSDLRMLQAQVAELAEALAASPGRRKADPDVPAPVKVTAAEKARLVAERRAAMPAAGRSRSTGAAAGRPRRRPSQ